MIPDQLRLILDAEADARRQLEAAQHECQCLVSEAEEYARRSVREARAARDALARSVEMRLIAEAEQAAQRTVAGAQTQAAAMRARAAPNMVRAVEAALRCVLGRAAPEGEA